MTPNKLIELKKAETKAQQELELAAAKAANLQRKAKAARAAAEAARLQHKRARKAAKLARREAAAAEDRARELLRVWKKAEKRFVKAGEEGGQGQREEAVESKASSCLKAP